MVFLIASHTNWREDEILWHDWHWVNRTLRRIKAQEFETRRWNLLRLCASAMIANSGGMGGFSVEGSMGYWQELVDATFSSEEVAARIEAEEAEENSILEEQRAERSRLLKAKRAPKEEVRKTSQEANMARLLADRARRGWTE